MNPMVSVVVVGKNVERTLQSCLDSIAQLDYPAYETLYVDDGSHDRSVAIAACFPNVRRLSAQGCGPSTARNLAIQQARGELVAFTDADCTVDRSWLSILVQKLVRHPQATGVGGRQRPSLQASAFELELYAFMESVAALIDYVRAPTSDTVPVAHNPSCNVLYRREALLNIGGFRDQLWPGEDVDLDYRLTRAGHLLLYDAHATVFHEKPNNLFGWISMMNRYGWAQGVLCRIHGVFRRLQVFALLTPLLLLFAAHFLRFRVRYLLIVLLSLLFLPSLKFRIALFGSISWLIGFFAGYAFPPHWTRQSQRALQPLSVRSS